MSLTVASVQPSCDGGKPTIQFPEEIRSNPGLSDAGLGKIEDVVTIDSGCAQSTTRGALRTSNLLFVLDRSGSMSCNLPEHGQSSKNCAEYPAALFEDLPTKWELTRAAVASAVSELKAAGRVRLGLSLFPESGTRCTAATAPILPISPLDDALETRLDAILSESSPGGETPLAGAAILGYAHLLELMRSGQLEGDTFIVVVTDGYETCKSDELPKLLNRDVPTALSAMGVRTFVIGAPGSDEGRSLLSEMAVAGGTAVDPSCTFGPLPSDGNCHYDMTRTADFSTDLLRALTRINSEVMTCNVDIPSAPYGGAVNLEEVNVMVNGVSHKMIADGPCNTSDGWRYSADFTTIQLCGEACRAAKKRGSEVTVILGCPTVIF